MYDLVENKITLSPKARKAQDIINGITGRGKSGENIKDRRIAALREAGFKVSYMGIKWNYSTSGTVSDRENGEIWAQLSCAIGCRTANGTSQNRCEIYIIE